MARTKQVAECMFCGKLPCECDGPKKERKPRAKKADATKVRSQASPVVRPTDEVLPREESPLPTGGSLSPGEELAVPLQAPRRKRARFTRGSAQEVSGDQPANSPVNDAELLLDEEEVAIRNLAHGGLLGTQALNQYARIIGRMPGDPPTRELSDWRKRHGATQSNLSTD